MYSKFVIPFFTVLILTFCSVSYAQAPVSKKTNSAFVVPLNLIEKKQFGKNQINHVASSSLKQGMNSVKLIDGNSVLLNYQNGSVISVSSGGIVYMTNVGSSLGFNCNGLVCVCTGDADCNDMFSGTACEGCFRCAVCVDNTCVCWTARKVPGNPSTGKNINTTVKTAKQ